MRKIKLSQDKYALVDDEDFEWLSQWKWTFMKHTHAIGYAYRKERGTQRSILMHRQMLEPKDGMVCDHINRNGLDNRRANLRVCTQQQNSFYSKKNKWATSSKYKGVHWCNTGQKWIAKVAVSGQMFSRSNKDWTEKQAAKAYDELATKHHGEFAEINGVD